MRSDHVFDFFERKKGTRVVSSPRGDKYHNLSTWRISRMRKNRGFATLLYVHVHFRQYISHYEIVGVEMSASCQRAGRDCSSPPRTLRCLSRFQLGKGDKLKKWSVFRQCWRGQNERKEYKLFSFPESGRNTRTKYKTAILLYVYGKCLFIDFFRGLSMHFLYVLDIQMCHRNTCII